jgi:hypothetical protein
MDRILGVLALAGFLAFLGVLIGFVPEPDLIVVCIVVASLAAWDFWKMIRRRGSSRRPPSTASSP